MPDCRWCGIHFEASKPNRRFCSNNHRFLWHKRNRIPPSKLEELVKQLVKNEVQNLQNHKGENMIMKKSNNSGKRESKIDTIDIKDLSLSFLPSLQSKWMEQVSQLRDLSIALRFPKEDQYALLQIRKAAKKLDLTLAYASTDEYIYIRANSNAKASNV